MDLAKNNSVSLKPRLWSLLTAMPTLPGFKVETLTGPGDYVILMHGLARSRTSMRPVAAHLNECGYHTLNVNYPSRSETIEDLVDNRLAAVVSEHCRDASRRIHFVGHSLGCILIRSFLKNAGDSERIGRAALIAPPNNGSEIVDRLKDKRWFRALMGPSAVQLVTDDDGIPRSIGAPPCEVGVIMGQRGYFPWFSSILPGENDGIVSVEGGKVPGIKDFIVLKASHSFIMCNTRGMRETAHFLHTGSFTDASRDGQAHQADVEDPASSESS